MARPLTIRRPKLLIQPLDAAGAPDGVAVDVSSDVRVLTLEPDQTIDKVSTFAGTFTTTGDVSSKCTVEGILSITSRSTWPDLVGVAVELQVFDTAESEEYRSFLSEISYDPSLYGGDDAESSQRDWSMELPVLSPIAWTTVAP